MTDDNIEYVITSCKCGNTDPKKYSPVGYRDWSRANGVPMVPIMMMCRACGNTGVKFRTEYKENDMHTFTETRSFLESALMDERWEPRPWDGGSYVHQKEWERLGRACAELSDKCNTMADGTDDVDGEAWDYLVDKFNLACGWIYPNGLEYPATVSDDDHRQLVKEALSDALKYIS